MPELRSDLINEYKGFARGVKRDRGVDLYSADEHLNDERLLPVQRAWLAAFVDRWERAVESPAPRDHPSYGEQLAAIGGSFSSSFWLQRAARELAGRDPLDAYYDALALVNLQAARINAPRSQG